jgi:hypothetical protein
MPINISTETLIPLIQAAAHLPRRRRGRKASASTLHRWATRGLRGVVLESLQVGGTRCTSLAALQRFFDKLSIARAGAGIRHIPTHSEDKRAKAADLELDRRWRGSTATEK